jgi:MFS superfamily sulfate permease-like transporter
VVVVASVVTVAVITVEDMAAVISSNSSSSPTVEMVVTVVTVVTAATTAAVMVSFDLVTAVLMKLGAGRPIEGLRASDESKYQANPRAFNRWRCQCWLRRRWW